VCFADVDIMFKRVVDTSCFNDDKRDTTEVPKQALNVLLDYLFILLSLCQACIYSVSLILYLRL